MSCKKGVLFTILLLIMVSLAIIVTNQTFSSDGIEEIDGIEETVESSDDNILPQQAVQLAYPLPRRYMINSFFDHTNPNYTRDNRIKIYTGDEVVCNGVPPNDCRCDWFNSTLVCGYTDGDLNLCDLRWNQDHPSPNVGGPGWIFYDGHPAYDLGCPWGTSVNAASSGTAYHVGENAMRIVHGSGYETYYYHLSRRIVGNGQYVHLGQEIARSGGDPAHLHFEVKYYGNPVDPYGLEGGGNLWAGGDPIPMGYRDQNGAAHGPFRIDRSKIRNKWLQVARRLGASVGDDFSYSCVPAGINAIGYMQGFLRGYIYYCGSGQAQVNYYDLTFLPTVRASEDSSAWNSFIHIRNLNPSGSATVNISFYNAAGEVIDSFTYKKLPSNGTWEINVRDILWYWLNHADYTATFNGSAVVASDQDVAVVVRTEKSDRVTAYTGISDANGYSPTGWGEPGTIIYVPVVMHNPWGSTWKSTLNVHNTSGFEADFTITYYRPDGTPGRTVRPAPLPPYGKGDYNTSVMGDGFWGSAKIVSNRPLAVVVTQEENTWGASQYNAFTSGDTTLNLPSLMWEWYKWKSGFVVINLGTLPTNIEIRYLEDNGDVTIRTYRNLAAGASLMVVQWDPVLGAPHPNWHGSAEIIASQPIVAIVNQQLDSPANNQKSHQSYSGFKVGGRSLYGPFAANGYVSGSYTYVSCSDVQNVGSSSTYISTKNSYFRPNGIFIEKSGSTVWTLPERVATLYLPAENVYSGFGGSVKITCTASEIAGIHNYARGPYQNDFGASYNIPQR